MTKINDTHTLTVRREAAEARQKQYDALTLDQKIERVEARRGNSSRELSRLLNQKLAS